MFKPLSPFQFNNRNVKDSFVLDVRTAAEYSTGNINGSFNINVDEIRNNLNKIPKGKKIMIYCGVGLRGYVASRILRQHGYDDVYNLSGGFKVYKQTMAEQSNPIFFNNLVEVEMA